MTISIIFSTEMSLQTKSFLMNHAHKMILLGQSKVFSLVYRKVRDRFQVKFNECGVTSKAGTDKSKIEFTLNFHIEESLTIDAVVSTPFEFTCLVESEYLKNTSMVNSTLIYRYYYFFRVLRT